MVIVGVMYWTGPPGRGMEPKTEVGNADLSIFGSFSHTMLDALSLSEALGYASMGCWLGAQFPYACILLAAVFILILLRYQPGGGKYQTTVMRRPCAAFSCQLAVRYNQTLPVFYFKTDLTLISQVIYPTLLDVS